MSNDKKINNDEKFKMNEKSKKSEKAKKAAELFLCGYNCSQSVVGAFADETGINIGTLLKLSSSFGGGMGCLREVCGAVSGMFIIEGILNGYSSPTDYEAKKAHYARIRALSEEFKKQHKTIICRELLQEIKTESTPQKRDNGYYKARPCVRFVETAAEILEKHLNDLKKSL